MCPVCIAAAALIAGKATSTGGVAALVVRKFRAPKPFANGDADNSSTQTKSKGDRT
jgi:hypothetical protein